MNVRGEQWFPIGTNFGTPEEISKMAMTREDSTKINWKPVGRASSAVSCFSSAMTDEIRPEEMKTSFECWIFLFYNLSLFVEVTLVAPFDKYKGMCTEEEEWKIYGTAPVFK